MVAKALGADIIRASVASMDCDHDRWRVGVRGDEGDATLDADGVVVTGPGPPKRVCATQPESHPRILDGREFWSETSRFQTLSGPADVCVIGSGETAAAIAVKLVGLLPPDSPIDIISPQGVVYSRGESYDENQLFSDPTYWPLLAKEHRTEFVRRTDRAVFSLGAKAV